MSKSFYSKLILFISTGFLMIGTGLFGTLVPLRLKDLGFEEVFIGFITSFFYLGMLSGSFQAVRFLVRAGHLITFTLCALALAVSCILLGISDNVALWLIGRFVSGYALAGLYISIESWLLGATTHQTRGKYLSAYMMILYGGTAASQALLAYLNKVTTIAFVISGVLVMFSLIPLFIHRLGIPKISSPKKSLGFRRLYKLSPSGILGCAISGVLIGAVYGLLPVYFRNIGYDIPLIGIMLTLCIAGGAILQYPFGIMSDVIDKKIVLIVLCFLVAISSLAVIFAHHQHGDNITATAFSIFVFGGAVFAIYPVSMSHACDYLGKERLVEITQVLMLAYGFGSVSGPMLISTFMGMFGTYGLFVHIILVSMLFACFVAIKLIAESKNAIVWQRDGDLEIQPSQED